jgi:transcriptional regulator with XRE-family HTH domain
MSDARATSAMDHALGRKLRDARAEAGLSQQALAERLGITFQQIQKYEKGANRIAASRLASIAEVLHRPISYFLEDPKELTPTHRNGGRPNGAAPPSPEQISLTRFFATIESVKVRRRVVDLLRAIIDADAARRQVVGAAKSARNSKKNAARDGHLGAVERHPDATVNAKARIAW